MRASSSALTEQVFVVAEGESGLRLDRFLSRRIPKMSRASLQQAICERVSISSRAAPKASRQVFAGEVITIRPREASAGALDWSAPTVLHESAGWLVADKPAGLATTPTAARPGEDMASLTGLHPAHRLDRFTSGCLVLTWEAEAARHFERAFREQRVRKEYLALVHGVPKDAAFVVDAAIAPDERSRVPGTMRVAGSGQGGADAVTEVSVLAASPDGATALVSARPRTGRKHQLRVHLAHAEHAIGGDLLYGGDERDFIRLQLGQPLAAESAAGCLPRHFMARA